MMRFVRRPFQTCMAVELSSYDQDFDFAAHGGADGVCGHIVISAVTLRYPWLRA